MLLLSASLGTVAYAQGDDEDSQSDSLAGRVAEILGIEQQRVDDAFKQAHTEIQEERQDRFFQNMIDEGILTEEEAAKYEEWLKSRPDMEEYKTQMKDWFELKPELPEDMEFEGFKFFRGKGGMRGIDEQNLPIR